MPASFLNSGQNHAADLIVGNTSIAFRVQTGNSNTAPTATQAGLVGSALSAADSATDSVVGGDTIRFAGTNPITTAGNAAEVIVRDITVPLHYWVRGTFTPVAVIVGDEISYVVDLRLVDDLTGTD